jgi:hypothetical protein
VIGMEVPLQAVVDTLRMMGLSEEADEALRELPDPVDQDQLSAFCNRLGIYSDDLISRMGGSP